MNGQAGGILAVAICVVLAASAGEARAVTGEEVCRILEEKQIPFDRDEVRRFAAEAVMKAVDPRARVVTKDELASLRGGATLDEAQAWAEGIGYIRLSGIHAGGVSNVARQLAEWQERNLAGLIFDLRGAGGNSLEDVDGISGLFLPGEPRLYTVGDGRGNVLEEHRALPAAEDVPRPPLMLLIDGSTRDASEVFSLALKGRNGVMLIGAPTQGDGALRELVPLAGDQFLYIATRWVRPLAAVGFRGVGVAPDVKVAEDSEGMTGTVRPEAAGLGKPLSAKALNDRELMLRVTQDPALLRATDILLGLKALASAGTARPEADAPDGNASAAVAP